MTRCPQTEKPNDETGAQNTEETVKSWAGQNFQQHKQNNATQVKKRKEKSGHLGNLASPTPQLNLANVAWNHVKIHMGERGAATGFVRFSDIEKF